MKIKIVIDGEELIFEDWVLPIFAHAIMNQMNMVEIEEEIEEVMAENAAV